MHEVTIGERCGREFGAKNVNVKVCMHGKEEKRFNERESMRIKKPSKKSKGAVVEKRHV